MRNNGTDVIMVEPNLINVEYGYRLRGDVLVLDVIGMMT